MIVRVRTNVGAWKVTISSSTPTIADLLHAIVSALNIRSSATSTVVSIGNVHVTHDLQGRQPLAESPYNTQVLLADVGVAHGSEVYLVGKYEKETIAHSFIDDHGGVVNAGTWLRRVDVAIEDSSPSAHEEKSDQKQPQQPHPDDQQQRLQHGNHMQHQNVVNDVANGESVALEKQQEQWQDDDVRAPDAVQRMTLVDDALHMPAIAARVDPGSSVIALTKEDEEQLQQLREQLRAAGIKEYSVEAEVSTLKDELLAKRMHAQMDLEQLRSMEVLRLRALDVDSSSRPFNAQELRQMTQILPDRGRVALEDYSAQQLAGSAGAMRAMRLVDEAKRNATRKRTSGVSRRTFPVASDSGTGEGQGWDMRRSAAGATVEQSLKISADDVNTATDRNSTLQRAGLRSLSAQNKLRPPLSTSSGPATGEKVAAVKEENAPTISLQGAGYKPLGEVANIRRPVKQQSKLSVQQQLQQRQREQRQEQGQRKQQQEHQRKQQQVLQQKQQHQLRRQQPGQEIRQQKPSQQVQGRRQTHIGQSQVRNRNDGNNNGAEDDALLAAAIAMSLEDAVVDKAKLSDDELMAQQLQEAADAEVAAQLQNDAEQYPVVGSDDDALLDLIRDRSMTTTTNSNTSAARVAPHTVAAVEQREEILQRISNMTERLELLQHELLTCDADSDGDGAVGSTAVPMYDEDDEALARALQESWND